MAKAGAARTRAAEQAAAEQGAVVGAGVGDHTRAPRMTPLLVVVVTLVRSIFTTFLLCPQLLLSWTITNGMSPGFMPHLLMFRLAKEIYLLRPLFLHTLLHHLLHLLLRQHLPILYHPL